MNKFRIQSKNILLTYSQAKGLNKYKLQEFIVNGTNLIIDKYVICSEKHNDGNKHYHILLKLEEKPDIKNECFFDYKGNHPNIKRVLFSERIFYVTKEDNNVLCNFNLDEYKKEVFNKMSYESLSVTLIDVMKRKNKDIALKLFYYYANNLTLVKYTIRVKKILNSVNELKEINTKLISNYNSNSFKKIKTLESYVDDFINGKQTKALYLGGVPRIGKTESVINYLNKRNVPFEYARKGEMLRNKSLEGKIIILDDDVFAGIKREELISYFETQQPHYLSARFNDIFIPAKVGKILLNNKPFKKLLKELKLENDKALVERIISTFLKDKLYNINVNIENLTININSNSKENNNSVELSDYIQEYSDDEEI
jgi:hypothetical protein